MRKATLVLLTVSTVLSFVLCGLNIIFGISCLYLACNPQSLLEYLVNTGMTGIDINIVKNVYCISFTIYGIALMISGCFAVATGILSAISRTKVKNGCEKRELKVISILTIVFGALSCEVAIVPSIFMLIMKEQNFHK